MIINLELDAAAQAAPSAIQNAWLDAADILNLFFADPIQVNIAVDWSGSGGGALGDPNFGLYASYDTVHNLLLNDRAPTQGETFFRSLPFGTSIQGASSVAVWTAEAKAIGLISGTATNVDGRTQFSTDISASLMVGVALHEFSRVLGCVPYSDINGGADIFDFFDFTSPGVRLFNNQIPAPAGYFSLDNGVTRWADFSQNSLPSDFLNDSLTTNDPFNEFYSSSTIQYLTPADIMELATLGYHCSRLAPDVDNHDMNGDGSGDILLQNGSGTMVYANMAGGAFQNWAFLGNTPGYTLEGAGKIKGSLDSDVVLENASGQILYGAVNDGVITTYIPIANTPGYNVVGVGDINGDQFADVVIQNPTTGNIVYANMANGFFANWVNVGSTPGWTVDAVAPIRNDGYADIVSQNASGQILYGDMFNGTLQGWITVGDAPGFKVVGAGDINRDGYADIVIQNQTSGEIDYANMAGGAFSGWVNIGSTPGFNVIAVEDVTNSGYQDIVIQQNGGGQLFYYNTTPGSMGWVFIGNAPGYTGHTDPADIGNTTLAPVSMFDPGPSDGSLGPVSMFDPGPSGGGLGPVSMLDPGPSSGGLGPVSMLDPGPSSGGLGPVSMLDPGPSSGGLGPVSMLDPGPVNTVDVAPKLFQSV